MQARLGIPVEVNRQEVRLSYGDSIYVCQVGMRLQEGQVLSQAELEAIPVTFWVVTVLRQAQDRSPALYPDAKLSDPEVQPDMQSGDMF